VKEQDIQPNFISNQVSSNTVTNQVQNLESPSIPNLKLSAQNVISTNLVQSAVSSNLSTNSVEQSMNPCFYQTRALEETLLTPVNSSMSAPILQVASLAVEITSSIKMGRSSPSVPLVVQPATNHMCKDRTKTGQILSKKGLHV